MACAGGAPAYSLFLYIRVIVCKVTTISRTLCALNLSSLRRSASARPATATTVLSGTMGISDWTFIFPESSFSGSSYQDKELNLPTLDDFDLQIAVFEVYAGMFCGIGCISLLYY